MVAIAITLLVLPLAELPSELDGGSVAGLLDDHLAEIGAFLLSFFVISRLWFGQHRVVSGLFVYDRTSGILLMLWTLTIVVLPFPTALVAETSNDATAKVLYIGTMALSSALLALIALVIGPPELWERGRSPEAAPAAITSLAFLLALAISLAIPATTYWPLLLLALTGPAVNLWRRRQSRLAS